MKVNKILLAIFLLTLIMTICTAWPYKGDIRSLVAKGNVNGVTLALWRGADPNYSDEFGDTSMMIAEKAGNLEMMRVLLDHGANLYGIDNSLIYEHGLPDTTIEDAVYHGRFDVAEFLLSRGGKIPEFNWKRMLEWAKKVGKEKEMEQMLKDHPEAIIRKYNDFLRKHVKY